VIVPYKGSKFKSEELMINDDDAKKQAIQTPFVLGEIAGARL
jgi:hypothetical protein